MYTLYLEQVSFSFDTNKQNDHTVTAV